MNNRVNLQHAIRRRVPRSGAGTEGLAATLIMIDTCAGWKGSLPAGEVAARVARARQVLAAHHEHVDLTFPGLFAAVPPPEFVPLLAAIAANVRPATLRRQLAIMAEADLSDLHPT